MRRVVGEEEKQEVSRQRRVIFRIMAERCYLCAPCDNTDDSIVILCTAHNFPFMYEHIRHMYGIYQRTCDDDYT